jgi:hypothetical protein
MTIHPRRPGKSVLALFLALFSLLAVSCLHTGAPSGNNPKIWKFAVISDTQGNNIDAVNKSCINDAVVQAIAADLVREKPDLALVAGDLINGWFRNGRTGYDTQYANWEKAMNPVYQAGIRVYPIRGNHDSGPERLALPPLPAHLEPPPDTVARMQETFRKHFAEHCIPQNGPAGERGLTCSFVHKNAFFIGLDQFTGSQHKIDQEWFERQLEGNRSPHLFVYGHEPAFGVNHKDNLGFFPKERDAFWNAIGRAGGKIYFCGHDHFYDRTLIPDDAGRPIRQMIAGTGGGVLKKWPGIYPDKRTQGEYHNDDYHGYVLVTVEDSRVKVVWKALIRPGTNDPWEIRDEFSYAVSMEDRKEGVK